MSTPYVMGPPASYTPAVHDLNEVVPPEVRSAIYADGMAKARAAAAAAGIRWAKPAERTHGPTGTCETHPGQPGGRTRAGDAWCGECRRNRPFRWTEELEQRIPDVEPPEEPW